jgi:hypothetical protein
MTLKEKFKQWLDTDPRLQIREVQLEVIAEEFAMDFAKWYYVNSPKYDAGHIFEGSEPPTNQRLLEIYKKEKGL